MKPTNVLIGSNATTYLCDFGIAAEFDSEAHWRDVVGTPPFVPPECFLTSHEDRERLLHNRYKYDQFSLGVTIYQLLTKQFPYGNVTEDSSRKENYTGIQLIKRKDFIPCHVINEKLPRTVNGIITSNRSHPPPRRRSGRAAIQAAAMAGIGGEGRLARAAAMSARA